MRTTVGVSVGSSIGGSVVGSSVGEAETVIGVSIGVTEVSVGTTWVFVGTTDVSVGKGVVVGDNDATDPKPTIWGNRNTMPTAHSNKPKKHVFWPGATDTFSILIVLNPAKTRKMPSSSNDTPK